MTQYLLENIIINYIFCLAENSYLFLMFSCCHLIYI